MLHSLESSPILPAKFFSIGKVFRNESVDNNHLAEFIQTEGIVIGNNLSMSNLIYLLKNYYDALGITIKIKPTYFPFVEPGLEIDFKNEKTGEEIELGGSGIIRKEITKAMGLNKSVLAWGLSLERVAAYLLGVSSIGDLYRNDIGWLRSRNNYRI